MSAAAGPDGDQSLRDDRYRLGQCPNCGTQLFKIKKKGLLNKTEVRKPLSTPGQVERGQCLKCLSSKPEDDGGHLLAAAAIASVGEETEADAPKPRAAQQQPNNATAGETVYIGDFNEIGERHGPGELLWSNGDKYVGCFVNGLRHGQGTLYFKDGSEYVGAWEKNVMHGAGTRRFKNGDVYIGNYTNGKRAGEGRFYFANGDMYYGNWEADQIHGFGRYYYNSGISFEGNFNYGKRHGKGKLQKRDGELEIYRYENNSRMDPGVRWSADRTKAWRLEGGRIKKSITIAEAVSIGYQCEGTMEDSRPTEDMTSSIGLPTVT